jgi:hypothetical protein
MKDERKVYWFLGRGRPEAKRKLGRPGIDGRIIFKLILEK